MHANLPGWPGRHAFACARVALLASARKKSGQIL
jgi:hypothetical protein